LSHVNAVSKYQANAGVLILRNVIPVVPFKLQYNFAEFSKCDRPIWYSGDTLGLSSLDIWLEN